MSNYQNILGMNARNRIYVSQNSTETRRICHSKLNTKLLMAEHGINTPQVYKIITEAHDIEEYNWSDLTDNFVIKPGNGSGGKGIIVIKRQISSETWTDTLGKSITLDEIKVHAADILEGKYSTHTNIGNNIIIEERIPIHPILLRYSFGGTPDLRIIIYNGVPVMAMLRLPTRESEGRANLHQGAIGVGIDLATGITTQAITASGNTIRYVPATRRKLNGLLVPFWHKALTTATEAAQAANLVYGGVDLFVHKEKGPMVVELNTQPGLQIQVANGLGLKRRLERVEGLNVLNPQHGVKIAQYLFSTDLVNKAPPAISQEKTVLQVNEEVIVIGDGKQRELVPAVVDTGRFRSAISRQLAEDLGLLDPEDLLWFTKGEGGERSPVIEVQLYLKKKKIKTSMVVSRALDKGRNRIKLGRQDLKDFVLNL